LLKVPSIHFIGTFQISFNTTSENKLNMPLHIFYVSVFGTINEVLQLHAAIICNSQRVWLGPWVKG